METSKYIDSSYSPCQSLVVSRDQVKKRTEKTNTAKVQT
jgi:hypothetical protein